MSCKSAIYTVNETITAGVPSGSVLDLGTISRRYGNNINLSGNGLILSGTGYYNINASVTVAPSTTDTVRIQLYKDGVPIPGAFASGYLGGAMTFDIPAIVRLQCCNSSSTLSLMATAGTAGTTLTISKVSITAEKL